MQLGSNAGSGMAMSKVEPSCGKTAQVRKFVEQQKRIEEAANRLSSGIDRLRDKMNPVLMPYCGEKALIKECAPKPLLCDFDTFISDLEAVLDKFLGDINDLSERSAV